VKVIVIFKGGAVVTNNQCLIKRTEEKSNNTVLELAPIITKIRDA
jgi:hypothetical protein